MNFTRVMPSGGSIVMERMTTDEYKTFVAMLRFIKHVKLSYGMTLAGTGIVEMADNILALLGE